MSRWLAAVVLLTGCNKLFSLEHVDDPPREAAPDMPAACGHRSVAAGRLHTCAVDGVGDVYCWGNNENGQAQPGAGLVAPTPAKVALPGPAVQVAAGRGNSCARLETGDVWCWGANDQGQLGQGVTSTPLGPSLIPLGGERASNVAVGAFHVCVRLESNGALMCWGDNRVSSVGTSGPAAVLSPTLIAPSGGMTELSTGHRHSCTIDGSGGVHCWGRGDEGQLGVGNATTPTLTNVAGISNATRISAGGRATCAVANGVASCWGYNNYGQLGTGNRDDVAAPGFSVVQNAKDVGASALGACALTVDGSVSCWGILWPGNGTYASSLVPTQSDVTGASDIAVGYYHVCVLVDGQARCWGNNVDGQLGRGTRDIAPSPKSVTLPGGASELVTHVAVGSNHACATTSSAVYCWGLNEYGQLGLGTHVSTGTIVAVPTGITGITGIAARQDHTCVWNDSTARCWGYNGAGVLGTSSSFDESAPVTVTAATPVLSMALGDQHSCAVTTNNAVRCWGRNNHGQLGDGTTADNFAGVNVGAGTVARIGAGNAHTCALKTDATVVCWGKNDRGQLGNDTVTDALSPVQATTASSDLAVGRNHTCAISNGSLYCWGDNGRGQLGLGDRTFRQKPVLVTLPAPPVDVEAAGDNTCVTLADNTSMCWGYGLRGELATGNVPSAQTLPAPVSDLAGASALSLGDGGGCAITGGALECWGVSVLLGDGVVTSAEPQPAMLPCP